MNHDPVCDEVGAHRLGGLLFLGFLLVGLVWGTYKIGSSSSELKDAGLKAWVDGSVTQKINKVLGIPSLQSFWAEKEAALRYRWLGDLGAQVSEGCPGWLFLDEGLKPLPGHAEAYQQRLRLMRHWADQIKSMGLELMVVTVPDKAQIQSNQRCGLRRDPMLDHRFDQWHTALTAHGVHHVNLAPGLSKIPEVYFRTDVHLSSAGAQVASEAIAPHALSLLGGKGASQFKLERELSPQMRMGDLIVLAGLASAPEGWRPASEYVVPESMRVLSSLDLLDDAPEPEVLLLGDSNALRSLFAERLGQLLGREIWNMGQDGGYYHAAMHKFLTQHAKAPKGLKLVIWQFSELALSKPLSDGERQEVAKLP